MMFLRTLAVSKRVAISGESSSSSCSSPRPPSSSSSAFWPGGDCCGRVRTDSRNLACYFGDTGSMSVMRQRDRQMRQTTQGAATLRDSGGHGIYFTILFHSICICQTHLPKCDRASRGGSLVPNGSIRDEVGFTIH